MLRRPTAEQRRLVEALGPKPRTDKLRAVVESLLSDGWWTTRDLALALGRNPSALVESHLGPMAKEGRLERRHAGVNHPDQAYRRATPPVAPPGAEPGR